jgi:hypothetical protein
MNHSCLSTARETWVKMSAASFSPASSASSMFLRIALANAA